MTAFAAHTDCTVFARACAALAALLLGGAAAHASALPTDPQRPFNETTCDAAKARYLEALIGSPLISIEEMEEVRAMARERVDHLCGPDVAQTLQTEFNAQTTK